jgi:hypothetical protein
MDARLPGLEHFVGHDRRKGLEEHFGKRQLRGITHSDIRAFRADRLAKPTKAKKQRSVAAVNREFEELRRLLNIAEREGWILRNPCAAGTR